MGVLRFPGLVTGIDTAALIKQLMVINSRRLATYQIKKTDYEKQTTALEELRSKISALQSAASALADADDMEIFRASTNDKDILTLGASSDASPGSHSIEVNQLATTETWIQDTSTFDYKTDYVGGGTFIYSYNYKETTITAIADETTLEDFVGLINNDADNPGVTASLLYHDGKYHLMLSGRETGRDYQISINATNTEIWQLDSAFTVDGENAALDTKIIDLDQFENGTFDDADGATINFASSTDHDGNAVTGSISITKYTTLSQVVAELEDAFDLYGTPTTKVTLVNGKIALTDLTSGTSSTTVSLAYDPGTGTTNLTGLGMSQTTQGGTVPESLLSLDSTTFTETQDAQNSEVRIDGYPNVAAEVQILTSSAKMTNGSYSFTYQGEITTAFTKNSTIADVQAGINALPNVSPGDIMVGGTVPSDDITDTMIFTFDSSLGNVSDITINGSPGPGTHTMSTQMQGDLGWISRNSNSITDALTGITLSLHDVTEAGTPIEVAISRNTGAVSNKIQTMVNAYNNLITELKRKTEYDSEAKKMGILSHDIAVSFIKSQTRDPFIGIAAGFVDTIDSFVQAFDIGLSIDGTGMMEFDTEEFNDAINDDFDDVLELLGATKSGNSSSTIIQFYNANDKYTTAGTYDVEVDIASNAITDVRIKLSSESTWRDNATWPNNLVSGNSDFTDDGDPLYPENSLQLTVDPIQPDNTYTATINVKQGIAGILEDLLDEVLEADGRLDTSKEILDDRITAMARRIEIEENRLNNVETRLIQKYARLEKTLAMMQMQMAAVGVLSSFTFGS